MTGGSVLFLVPDMLRLSLCNVVLGVSRTPAYSHAAPRKQAKGYNLFRQSKWSGERESNPRLRYPKPGFYRYNTARGLLDFVSVLTDTSAATDGVPAVLVFQQEGGVVRVRHEPPRTITQGEKVTRTGRSLLRVVGVNGQTVVVLGRAPGYGSTLESVWRRIHNV